MNPLDLAAFVGTTWKKGPVTRRVDGIEAFANSGCLVVVAEETVTRRRYNRPGAEYTATCTRRCYASQWMKWIHGARRVRREVAA